MTQPSKEERPWIPSEILAYARHEGITLFVPPDEYRVIVAGVKKPLPDCFKDGMKEWKETVMRHALRQQAYAYLEKRWVKGAKEENLEPYFVPLAEGGDMDEYRVKVREFVKAGLKEIARVKALTEGNGK